MAQMFTFDRCPNSRCGMAMSPEDISKIVSGNAQCSACGYRLPQTRSELIPVSKKRGSDDEYVSSTKKKKV